MPCTYRLSFRSMPSSETVETPTFPDIVLFEHALPTGDQHRVHAVYCYTLWIASVCLLAWLSMDPQTADILLQFYCIQIPNAVNFPRTRSPPNAQAQVHA
ncbi:hypothetical protein PTI98_008834 [Pleurotus ostreatus]|nr:hypothetical protein PTI98_008834 [Pleurotus ostreatus]